MFAKLALRKFRKERRVALTSESSFQIEIISHKNPTHTRIDIDIVQTVCLCFFAQYVPDKCL
jgi:hypothetical protein